LAGSEPEHTPDGHHVVIDGRKWRATDPHIPDGLRQELVTELMSARRAVKADEPDARARVGDAKVALGERGHPWWDERTPDTLLPRAGATIRALLRKRDGSTICPSDVARVVGGTDWRRWMPDIRRLADELAEAGQVVVTQRGAVVTAQDATGAVRIGRGERFDA
jgi:hypothetical protein